MVQTLTTRMVAMDADLFDNSAGYDDETGVQFAPGLSAEERLQATKLYRLFNGLWGLCLVTGDPGTGKDLFGNYIAYKIKTYFLQKRILRDERPRELFGEYAGLFNDHVIKSELDKMRQVAKGAGLNYGEALQRAADSWVTKDGVVLLKNSLLYLTEFWRYCSRREPMSPMNRTMGGIHKEKRHIDVLLLGTSQLDSDLDRKTCLPWVDWKVFCGRSAHNTTGFTYNIFKVKYDRRRDILEPVVSSPFTLAIDGGRPRSDLGNGKIVLRKPNYSPETEEERIVLDVLRMGYDTYESLVELIYDEGDMTEDEILVTLKELRFRKYKRVIDYPCWFGLYNSKSAPQMTTSLKMED